MCDENELSAIEFDPTKTMQLRLTGFLRTSRGSSTSVMIEDGTVYIGGGWFGADEWDEAVRRVDLLKWQFVRLQAEYVRLNKEQTT